MSTRKILITAFVLVLLMEESFRWMQSASSAESLSEMRAVEEIETPRWLRSSSTDSGGLIEGERREVGEKPTIHLVSGTTPLWISHTLDFTISFLSRTMNVVVSDDNHAPDTMTACFRNECYYPANDPPSRSGIFHWADELGEYWKQVPYKEAAFIIRNYFIPEVFEAFPDKVLWIPVGNVDHLRSNTPIIPPVLERPINCSWLGSFDAGVPGLRAKSRSEMIEALDPDLCYIESSSGFMGKQTEVDYAQFVGNSKFTLCPWGNTEETIRFFDALEIGSIPIILSGASFIDHMLSIVPG